MPFIWARARYGNNIRVDPAEDPTGGESLSLELCNSVGATEGEVCNGGEINLNVGLTQEYSRGPNKFTTNGNVPHFGLYRMTFFPFEAGTDYTLLVRHNGQTVTCYFNVEAFPAFGPEGLPDAVLTAFLSDMSALADESCNAVATARRRELGASRQLHQVAGIVQVTTGSSVLINPAFRAYSTASPPPLCPSPPSSSPIVTSTDRSAGLADTEKGRYWMMYGIVVCAGVGVFLDLVMAIWDKVVTSKRQKTYDTILRDYRQKADEEEEEAFKPPTQGEVVFALGEEGMPSADAQGNSTAEAAPSRPAVPTYLTFLQVYPAPPPSSPSSPEPYTLNPCRQLYSL